MAVRLWQLEELLLIGFVLDIATVSGVIVVTRFIIAVAILNVVISPCILHISVGLFCLICGISSSLSTHIMWCRCKCRCL